MNKTLFSLFGYLMVGGLQAQTIFDTSAFQGLTDQGDSAIFTYGEGNLQFGTMEMNSISGPTTGFVTSNGSVNGHYGFSAQNSIPSLKSSIAFTTLKPSWVEVTSAQGVWEGDSAELAMMTFDLGAGGSWDVLTNDTGLTVSAEDGLLKIGNTGGASNNLDLSAFNLVVRGQVGSAGVSAIDATWTGGKNHHGVTFRAADSDINPLPEPSSMALLGLASLSVLLRRKR